MRIDSIDVYRVRMPLVYPFRTAFGNDETIESVLVRIGSEGLYGWGEASPWERPAYCPESAAGVFLTLKNFLAPRILGTEIGSGRELQDALGLIKGNHFAKATLDLAWWDLDAKRAGVPLYRHLGGRKSTVDVGADFGIMETVDDLIATMGEALERGFKRIKLKYRPGWELDMMRPVRAAFPDAVIHVDCNSAYTLDDREMLTALDEFGLAMIEQPLMHDDLIDHATLQRALKTPICLDESITSPAKARQAIEIGACGWVNIKPGRVGGLTQAKAIHDLCQASDVPCWIGGMLESAVGGHHCLALATLENIHYPSDIFPSERFYQQDLSTPSLGLCAPSQMKLPDTPGCGAEPVPELLTAQCVEAFHLPA
ncbi:MAG: o-succinylbenzoate synthase [Planctomycetota bacterium]|jgi:O-succinylbenzoate synthase